MSLTEEGGLEVRGEKGERTVGASPVLLVMGCHSLNKDMCVRSRTQSIEVLVGSVEWLTVGERVVSDGGCEY